ncbi:hypothetical protein Tco_1158078 [Tanacetum coccineum]
MRMITKIGMAKDIEMEVEDVEMMEMVMVGGLKTMEIMGITRVELKLLPMESELWNLTVKGNDLTAYTQRFQELILLCSKMVPKKDDRVERYIWGIPDNIQGNVTASGPKRLQDVVGWQAA